jgi:hypothetical protein
VGTLAALRSVSQSALLDRLIRSRVWIGLLAFSLIGIVAMQLLVLRLNNDVGRLLARAATLQRQTTLTRIADSSTSSGQVVEPAAAASGMSVAAAGSLRFVSISPGDVARAARVLQQPIQAAPAPEAASAPEAAAIAPEATASAQETTTPVGEAARPSPASSAPQGAPSSEASGG